MKCLFKQAASLGGKDYSVGIHEVPDEIVDKSAFFSHLVKHGLVCDPDEVKKPKSLPPAPDHPLVKKVLEDAKAKPAEEAEAKAKAEESELDDLEKSVEKDEKKQKKFKK